MEKKILVITVTYNGEKWIRRCVGSVRESILPAGITADIMVIDNMSTDRTLECLPKEGIILVRNTENAGFGAANNIGFEYATEHGYDYVYLLNQDAYLLPDTLAKLASVHSWSPEYAVLSPVQMNADGNIDFRFRKKTGIAGTTEYDIPVPVDFVMAAHWLVPVDVIRELGAFSPSFHHYGEDDNYCDRAHYHGYKTGVVTSVAGIHDRGGRKEDKERHCRMKCLIPVIRMSDPSPRAWSWTRGFLWLLLCSIRNFSMIPVKSAGRLWKRRGELKENRRLSRDTKGAFLTRS